MRRASSGLALVTALLVGLALPLARPEAAPAGARPDAAQPNRGLPMAFEPNLGQGPAGARFLARGAGYTLSVHPTEVVLALRATAPAGPPARPGRAAPAAANGILRLSFDGARPPGVVEALEPLPGKVNYFIGRDPRRWRTGIPTYARVRYRGLYPGIDLVLYGHAGELEYDLIVAPRADPRQVALAFEGAERLELDTQGDLLIHGAHGHLRQRKPRIYQEAAGTRTEVAGGYVLTGERRVTFRVGDYDPTRPLIIDPVLTYSTYLGGSGADLGLAIAVDATGSAYVTGQTSSADFPQVNALQPLAAGTDVFIAKVNPAGSALVYSTYLGGTGSEIGHSIAVDAEGNAYVTGVTQSADFPTVNTFQAPPGGAEDGFVAKLDATGSVLVYSSYLGGSNTDIGRAIRVDAAGNAYVTGQTMSTDFPVTPGGFQPTCANSFDSDAFVTKVSPTGTALVYATCLGGTSVDVGWAIAVDADGNAYVTGETISSNLPVTPGAVQPTCRGCQRNRFDAFVTKLDPAGSALVYSTYLGGSIDDFGRGIAVDTAGSAYITGEAESSDFPTTPGAFATTGGFDAFVTKLNPSGSALTYSTYLGGSVQDEGLAIALDADGNAYVTGATKSLDFPTANPVQPAHGGAGSPDAFVAKLNATGSALVFSTFLGGLSLDQGHGVAVNAAGSIFIAGETFSTDFPTANPVQPAAGGGFDAFVARIEPSPSCVGTGAHTLRGRVKAARGRGIPDATLTLSGANGCSDTTVTNRRGRYRFPALADGTYTVTPSRSGCTFTPPSRTATLAGAGARADFTASCL